jgi:hypothetical protein
METIQHIKLSTLIDKGILAAMENDPDEFNAYRGRISDYFNYDSSASLSTLDQQDLQQHSYLRNLPLHNTDYFLGTLRKLFFDISIRFDSEHIVETLLPAFIVDQTFPDEWFILAIEHSSKKSLIKLIDALDFPAMYLKGERVNVIPIIISYRKYSLAREIGNYFQIRCDYIDASCSKTENYSAITYIIEHSKSELDSLNGIMVALELGAETTGITNSIHPSPIESTASKSFICFNYLYALFQLGNYSKSEYNPTELICIALKSKHHDMCTKIKFIDLLEGENIDYLVILENIIEMDINEVLTILIHSLCKGIVAEDQVFQYLIESKRKDIIKVLKEYAYFTKYRLR